MLVVEDAPDIREVFAVLLETEGATVIATGTAREAAELARRHEFDVLLTDFGLPDLPGDALIRRVLATMKTRPRVIVVTGFGEPYVSRARDAGADVVMTKPIEWSELLGHLGVTTGAVAA